jgi:hypothetical protein
MKTRKQLVAVVTLAVFMLVLLCPSVRTQEQESTATLKDTTDWIHGTMGSSGTVIVSSSPHETYQTDNVDFSGCTLKYDTFNFNRDTESDQTVSYQLSLTDLDVLGIKIGPVKHNPDPKASNGWVIMTLTTARNEKKIKTSMRTFSNNNAKKDEFVNNEAFFTVNSEETAKRLKRAFEHAIKLCGGKVDPF